MTRTRCRVSGSRLRVDVKTWRQRQSFPNITDRLRDVVSRSAHLCANVSRSLDRVVSYVTISGDRDRHGGPDRYLPATRIPRHPTAPKAGRTATRSLFAATPGRKSTDVAFRFESRPTICVRMPPLVRPGDRPKRTSRPLGDTGFDSQPDANDGQPLATYAL